MTIEVVAGTAPGVSAAEPTTPAPMQYIGLATRAIAAAIDAALINAVVVIVGVGVSLIASLIFIPSWLRTVSLAIGAAAYVAWVVGYFVLFWSSTGQTPGDRMMMFRVVMTNGDRLRLRRALLRCATTVLAALPLFAGFLLILFDGRRRALNDVLAGTVVIDAPGQSLAAATRDRGRPNSSQSGDVALPPVQDRSQRRDDHASLRS